MNELVKIAFHDPDVIAVCYGYERYEVVDGVAEISPAAARHFVAAGLAVEADEVRQTKSVEPAASAGWAWDGEEETDGDEDVAEESEE
jgi:hypothetical protein